MNATPLLSKIGNTSYKKLDHLFPGHSIYLKLELLNPSGSIKDRAALKMIKEALKSQDLSSSKYILEASSGNLGISLAMIGRELGIKVKIAMPESMSHERRDLIKSYGGDLILTNAKLGMKGAVDKCLEILENDKNAWMPNQFENPNNPKAHRETTAQEISSKFENINFLIGAIGSSGHMCGISEVLKAHYRELKSYAVEPFESQVLSGKESGPHGIEGIGAGFVPKIYNAALIDKIMAVSTEDAFLYAKKLSKKENIFAGPSTGANIKAIDRLIQEKVISKESIVLSFAYDTGDRYLSLKRD